MGLAGHRLRDVLAGAVNRLERPQMVMGMDRFRIRRGPKQPCGLGVTLLIGLGGKGQILAIGLGFAREGFL